MTKVIPQTLSLSRLLYTSRSAMSGSRQEQINKVDKLVREARARNRQASLTGTLLLVDDTFIQVLEGPTQNVESVFEAICCDLRHRDISLVDLLPANKRIFEDREMAFLAKEDGSSASITTDLRELRQMISMSAREAERHMRDLVQEAA